MVSGLVVGSLELPQSVVELKLIVHKLDEIKLQLKVGSFFFILIDFKVTNKHRWASLTQNLSS
jgi:hypothetical protein